MTETIEVKYKYLFNSPYGGVYHTYVVYTDEDGNKYYARGSDSAVVGDGGITPFSPLGTLEGYTGAYNSGSPYDWSTTDHSDPIISGTDLSSYWDSIQATNDWFNENPMAYGPDTNSNSVTATELDRAGLSQPEDGGLGNYYAPGLDNVIPTDWSPIPGGIPDPAAWVGAVGSACVAAKSPLMWAYDKGGPGAWSRYAYVSPLVMDLDGTGINLVSMDSANSVYWDIDIDGVKEHSGWIAGNTGLLAVDWNSNGVIDNNGELFGNQPTSGVANGFDDLATYDTNTDGHITSADDIWSSLRVWVDSNGDAVSQSGELHTLDSLGITDIDLGYSSSSDTIADNEIKQTSTFTIGGDTHAIDDAWFQYDDLNSSFMGDYTLNPDTLFLPDQRGYGGLTDLHIAMSQDAGTGGTLDMIHDLYSQTPAEMFDPEYELKGKIADIIYRWASVGDVASDSRGDYFDARKLDVLEKLTGQQYFASDAGPDVYQAPGFEGAWQQAFNTLSAHLLGQTALGSLMGEPVYSVITDNMTIGAGTADTDILFAADNISSGAITASANNDVYIFQPGDTESSSGNVTIDEAVDNGTDTIMFANGVSPDDVKMWTTYYGELVVKYSDTDQITLTGGVNGNNENLIGQHVERMSFDDETTWDLTGGLNLENPGSASTLWGTAYGDTLTASGTGSTLYGYGGDDALVAASSGTYMFGGVGDDTYSFTAGSGDSATLYEATGAGTDTIALHDVAAADVKMWTDGYGELLIKYDSGDTITLLAGYNGNNENLVGQHFEQVAFDDTTTWDLTGGLNLETPTSSSTLYGTAYGDTETASGAGSTLYGYGGDDTLVGGGNGSYLYGGAGADTFVFESATAYNGIDTIGDFSTGSSDVIDIRSLMSAYTPGVSTLSDFVQAVNDGYGGSNLQVDRDGTGGTYGFQTIASITGVSSINVATYVSNGNLLVA